MFFYFAVLGMIPTLSYYALFRQSFSIKYVHTSYVKACTFVKILTFLSVAALLQFDNSLLLDECVIQFLKDWHLPFDLNPIWTIKRTIEMVA